MKPSKQRASYQWRGHDAQGKSKQGILQASNAALAHAQLQRSGIKVEQLHRRWWTRSPGLKTREITAMTRQWSALIRAGISLVPSLQMLQRSAATPAMGALLEQVQQDVEGGMPLSVALQRHPRHCPALQRRRPGSRPGTAGHDGETGQGRGRPDGSGSPPVPGGGRFPVH